MAVELALCNGESTFIYRCSKQTYKNKLRNIVLFEKDGRNVQIKSVDGNCSNICCSLNELTALLNESGFELVNRSIIVNYSHIIELNKSHMIMDNGQGFDISRIKEKSISEGMIQHLY